MKRALLVGINYENTAYSLRGCINDIRLIKGMLIDKFEFSECDITVLLEDRATCSAIVENMERLVRESRSGDQLYIHYSGHGSQYRDMNADETDQLDEIIIGYDHNWSDRMIRDDDLARIFSVLAEGVELVVVHDCCHSGDGLRVFPTEENFKKGIRSRHIDYPRSIFELGINRSISAMIIEYSNQKGILISGCRSDETSADAYIGDSYNGALTYCLVNLLNQYPKISYRELVERLNGLLGQLGFSQHPELNCDSEYFDNRFLGGYQDEAF